MNKPVTIQIVDDGMELCRELRGWLEQAGHAVACSPPVRTLLTGLAYPLQDGLYRLDRECWLYTSRGTGYWGPPKRFGAPSEITRIRLVPQRSPSTA